MDRLYAHSRLRFYKNIITRVKRYPSYHRGRLLVSVGDEVSPSDILGEGQSPLGFRTIYLSQELGVSPKEAVSCLKRSLGQTIYRGELLAAKKEILGLHERKILSPVDGVVVFYNQERGVLKIKLLPKQVKTVSGVYGVVEKVDEAIHEVTIKASVSVIYGVLGWGKERGGILKVLSSAEAPITPRRISENMSGQIVAGGSLIFSETLKKAVMLGVAGVICGGIDAGDYKAISGHYVNVLGTNDTDIGLTVVATEGFGLAPMSSELFAVLEEYNGKFVILGGGFGGMILPTDDPDSMIDIRKARVPQDLPWELETNRKESELREGVSVRVISSPFFANSGVVEGIDRTSTKLSSGAETVMVTMRNSMRKIRVPYQNLEIVEEKIG